MADTPNFIPGKTGEFIMHSVNTSASVLATISAMVFGLLIFGTLSASADFGKHEALHLTHSAAPEANAQTYDIMDDMLGPKHQPDMEEVEKHSLGSYENPVRCDMPGGERAYLRRLRCENNKAPSFNRLGSGGTSPWNRIMDEYDVQCSSNTKGPKKFRIFMDMYHADYKEKRPVPGFTIVPPR